MLPKVHDIIREEALRGDCTVGELLGSSHNGHVARVRHYAMWRARKETKRSFPELGLIFGRDHSTIQYAVARVEKMEPAQRGVYPVRPAPKVKRRPPETYMGPPCRSGHSGLRYTTTFRCVVCTKAQRAREYLRSRYRHTLEVSVAAE